MNNAVDIEKIINKTRYDLLRLYYPQLLNNLPAQALIELTAENYFGLKYIENNELFFTKNPEKIFFSAESFFPIFPGIISDIKLSQEKLSFNIIKNSNFSYDFNYCYIYFCDENDYTDIFALLECCLSSFVRVTSSPRRRESSKITVSKILYSDPITDFNNLISNPKKYLFLKISWDKNFDINRYEKLNICFNFTEKLEAILVLDDIKFNIISINNLIKSYAEPIYLNYQQDNYPLHNPYCSKLLPYDILKITYQDNNQLGLEEKFVNHAIFSSNSDLSYKFIYPNSISFNAKELITKNLFVYASWYSPEKLLLENNCNFYFYQKSNQNIKFKTLQFSPGKERLEIPSEFLLKFINLKNLYHLELDTFRVIMSVFIIHPELQKYLSLIKNMTGDKDALTLHLNILTDNQKDKLIVRYICRYLHEFFNDLLWEITTYKISYGN